MGCNFCNGNGSWIIILILLLCCCGNNGNDSYGYNCGGCGRDSGCGCGRDSGCGCGC